MRTKDSILLEQAYQSIFEAKETTPCPCTLGKKCKKKDCPCPKCKKAKAKLMKEMHDEESVSNASHTLSRIKAAISAGDSDPEANSPDAVLAHIEEILHGGGHQDQSHYTTTSPEGF